MPKQYEHDVSASIAEVKEALSVTGQFGGGRIDHFRKGWAMDIWGGKKVHYWTRSFSMVKSRCGLIDTLEWTDCNDKQHPRLHGGGDFPRCKRCENL